MPLTAMSTLSCQTETKQRALEQASYNDNEVVVVWAFNKSAFCLLLLSAQFFMSAHLINIRFRFLPIFFEALKHAKGTQWKPYKAG